MFRKAEPIQIIQPVAHGFYLRMDSLNRILEAEDIKDRYVVIVSIAGDLRKGKSFMLNWFLKYLYARYKKHDVTDWIGENETNRALDGFRWRGGQNPETTGIWMWSEIFTHDSKDGEKLAIILLDTQGIFDNGSTMQENIMTFAISMMIASVQCYNVMQKMQENDLQNLHLFSEYGELVMRQFEEQFRETPFQTLLFLVRDWPYHDEIAYGKSEGYVKKLLTTNNKQPDEIRLLRERVSASFEQIKAFLLPHPGLKVAQTKSFDGKLSEIDKNFIKYVKELVPSLLAPENLIVKKINGQKVRARDLINCLEQYVDIFQGDELPQPETILVATAKAEYQILYSECLDTYTKAVEHSFNEIRSRSKPYFEDVDLQKTHTKAHTATLAQFEQKRKLGGRKLISMFRVQLLKALEKKYVHFQRKNECKQMVYNSKNQKETFSNFAWKVGVSLALGAVAVYAPVVIGGAFVGLIRWFR